MAMGVTALAAATTNTTNNAASHTGTAGTPAAGDLLIAFVAVDGNTAVGSMSGQWTWNFLTSVVKNASADTMYVFWAYASTATSTTPVYTINGNSTGSSMSVLRITGVDGQTQPYLRQWGKLENASASGAVSMPRAILTGSGCIAAGYHNSNAAVVTIPTGWTAEVHDVAHGSPAGELETCYRTSGETGSTITLGGVSNLFCAIVLELYVAGAGVTEDGSGGSGYYGGISSI